MAEKRNNHRRKNKTPKVYTELDLGEFKDIVKVEEAETMFEKEMKEKRKHYKNKEKGKKPYKKQNNGSKHTNKRKKEDKKEQK